VLLKNAGIELFFSLKQARKFGVFSQSLASTTNEVGFEDLSLLN
jgi:hypothetical protein